MSGILESTEQRRVDADSEVVEESFSAHDLFNNFCRCHVCVACGYCGNGLMCQDMNIPCRNPHLLIHTATQDV